MEKAIDKIWALAKSVEMTVMLPEASDARTLKAARICEEERLARIVLVGDEARIAELARQEAVSLDCIEIINPATSPLLDEYSALLYELRKSKGMTPEQAREIAQDELYFGCLHVKAGRANGQVSGAIHSTADTVRPALQILRTAPGCKLVSAFFLMEVPDCEYGNNGTFFFADSGLVENPNAEELAEIAITTAKTCKTLLGIEPYVAMLSYSTKGSANSVLTEKVVEATRIAKEREPGLLLDGELQVDAAIVPWVGESKAPGSPVAGKANVLIFPELSSGNIAYKLVQRLAKADATGPILQGIARPVNDLSRGCSVEDIVNAVAITVAQATAN